MYIHIYIKVLKYRYLRLFSHPAFVVYTLQVLFRFMAGYGAGGGTMNPAIRTTIIRTMTTLGRWTPSSLPRTPSWTLVRSGQSGGRRSRSLTNRIMWRLSPFGIIHFLLAEFYTLNDRDWCKAVAKESVIFRHGFSLFELVVSNSS
jgi:hypothetical protein